MPKGAVAKSVDLYGYRGLTGFKFYDRNHTLIWKIGDTAEYLDKETVMLNENEVFIGVKAKLEEGWQSSYTNFQF